MKGYRKITRIVAALFCFFCTAILFSCNHSPDSSVYTGPKSVSDWLFLLYMDADDTGINDNLYVNIRMAECALALIRNPDGTPKEGHPSINIVALWDGISEELKGQSMFVHPDAALYELGADYELAKKDTIPDTEFTLSPETKELTETGRYWLKKEPDMGDPETFEGFLKWAKTRYASENVVICLNDHGAGTHKETYYDVTASSRSLCSDATNAALTKKRLLLTCAGIKEALTSAGYTGSDKPKILWNDLCLQSTAEIVYNFAGCAEYFSASPNTSFMNDWVILFYGIADDSTPLDVGKLIVSAYYNSYNTFGANFHQGTEAKNYRSSGGSMYTWSLLSLDEKKSEALKNAVDNFAEDLLLIYDTDSAAFNAVYENYIKQDDSDLTKCRGLAYPGTYAYLNDLGWLAKDVLSDSGLSAAHSSAQAILDLLKHGDDNLIAYAWGGNRALSEKSDASGWDEVTAHSMYLTGQKDFSSGEAVDVEYDDDIYGLTIVAGPRPYTNKTTGERLLYTDSIRNYYDWTDFSEKWAQVINAWLDAGL